MADEGCGGIAHAKDAAHGLTHVCHACGNGRCVGGGGVTMVVGSLCVRRRDRAMEPRKLKDQRRMQRSRARKRCAGLWGMSQHRARAPHATAAGGLRVIWPWCVAVWSKGPRSAEHAYICDVRRTAKVEWTCGTEHVYRRSVRYRGAHLRFCSLSRGLRACLLGCPPRSSFPPLRFLIIPSEHCVHERRRVSELLLQVLVHRRENDTYLCDLGCVEA